MRLTRRGEETPDKEEVQHAVSDRDARPTLTLGVTQRERGFMIPCPLSHSPSIPPFHPSDPHIQIFPQYKYFVAGINIINFYPMVDSDSLVIFYAENQTKQVRKMSFLTSVMNLES